MTEIDMRLMPARRRPVQFALATFETVVALLGQWRQRALDRHRLGTFDDRMLKDIGLSRADIDVEVTKPFWRG